MNWKINFYSAKVEKGIDNWPLGIRAKFTQIVDLIEEFGPETIGMPHIKSLGQGLFEIRAKGVEGIGRALFCMVKGKVIIILSEFIKKSQKTPLKELSLAKKRMMEVKSDE
jgi:phage-related protein